MASPGLLQLQAGPQRLHAQMILFVDHHAERFLRFKTRPLPGVLGGVFAADQMALHQDLLVQRASGYPSIAENAFVHLRQ